MRDGDVTIPESRLERLLEARHFRHRLRLPRLPRQRECDPSLCELLAELLRE